VAEFQGKRVSRTWRRVLRQAERDGVRFRLNSGRRTLAEQWRLYRAWRNGTGNLAAYPSPTAPHIRVGRPDHALDVDSLWGGENALQRYLQRHGVTATNTVAGEAWHLEAGLTGLVRFAHRIRRRQRRRRRA
jgi:hypothetical protein